MCSVLPVEHDPRYIEPIKSSTLGFIYIVQMDGHPLYKIGRSVNVPRRMSEFGVLLPFPFTLILALRVMKHETVERALHKKYDSKRKNGEWFELSVDDVLTARSLLLTWQAESQKHRVVNRMFEDIRRDGDISERKLFQYGRVFSRTAVRIHRRTRLGWPSPEVLDVRGVN